MTKKKTTPKKPTKKAATPPRKPPEKPPVVATDGKDDFERRREQQAEISRSRSEKGRDIGGIPDIADVGRREECSQSLRRFCEVYNPETFYRGWANYHLSAIARIEEGIRGGSLYCMSFPRGSGKSSIMRMAVLWMLANAHARYAFIVGANAGKAAENLDAIKIFARFLPLFSADYPDISFPVAALTGIAHRARGQTCKGQSTLIEWSGDRIVLPTVSPPSNWPPHWKLRPDGMVPSSGAIAVTSGLTGEGIRGSLLTLSTGESIRPDFVLLDDPQTGESSRYKSQSHMREQLVSQDVLGMRGPGKPMSAVMAATVISRGDMVDNLLDRKKHPLWRGERHGILSTMPKNMTAWQNYFDVYARCSQLEPPDLTEANSAYLTTRSTLDEGTQATWPERKLDGEISAIQSAMHLYFADPTGFMSEYMNDPVPDTPEASFALEPEEVIAKTSNLPRCMVPRNCSRLTAAIDVGAHLIWWMVCAWDERFGGTIIGYGVYPEQVGRTYFAKSDPRPGLGDLPTNYGIAQQAIVYSGLTAVANTILGTAYKQEETGGELRIGKVLIDANWGPGTDTVYEFARRSPHAAIITPSHGRFIGASGQPMSSWNIDRGKGEILGTNWVLKVESGKRRVLVDVNSWKTFCAERIRTPEGGSGCLRLHAPGPGGHMLLADHFGAEYPVGVQRQSGSRVVNEWRALVGRDNDWWDTLILNAVAGSMLGTTWSAAGTSPSPPKPRRLNVEEQYKLARERERQQQGGRR